MPKTKKPAQSDSESDSGSEDRNPPPSKKSKGSKSDQDGEDSWLLENKRFVKISEFRGKVMIDIREYYEKDGELKPGKKGISLSATQWRKLVSFVEEINEAIAKK